MTHCDRLSIPVCIPGSPSLHCNTNNKSDEQHASFTNVANTDDPLPLLQIYHKIREVVYYLFQTKKEDQTGTCDDIKKVWTCLTETTLATFANEL